MKKFFILVLGMIMLMLIPINVKADDEVEIGVDQEESNIEYVEIDQEMESFSVGHKVSLEEEIRQFGAAFLGMPVFFLLFSYFTCYMDEQTQINELRNTMYYSMNYIVSLRLFYTAVVLSLVNTSFLFLSGIREKAILSVGVVGVSSMLVFAIIAVYIYHRWNNYKCFAGLGAIWVLLFAAIMRLPETKILFLFEYIPLGIQIATMIVCFVALFTLVGRMEEKDAYTFAY